MKDLVKQAAEITAILPETLIHWLEDRFKLTPYLTRNQELELPAEKLLNFEVEGNPEEIPATSLVKILVATPGWKQTYKQIILPRAKII